MVSQLLVKRLMIEFVHHAKTDLDARLSYGRDYLTDQLESILVDTSVVIPVDLKESKVEQLCALSDITEVRVKSSYGDGTTMYQVVLELKNGDTIGIFNSSSSVKSHHEKDAEAIRQFLKFRLSTQNELLIKDNFFVGGIIFMIFGVIFICAGGGIAVASHFAETVVNFYGNELNNGG